MFYVMKNEIYFNNEKVAECNSHKEAIKTVNFIIQESGTDQFKEVESFYNKNFKRYVINALGNNNVWVHVCTVALEN